MKRLGSTAPRHLPLPIAALIALGATGAATVQPAGAQAILVVSATGIDCQGKQLAYTSIQTAGNLQCREARFAFAPGPMPNR